MALSELKREGAKVLPSPWGHGKRGTPRGNGESHYTYTSQPPRLDSSCSKDRFDVLESNNPDPVISPSELDRQSRLADLAWNRVTEIPVYDEEAALVVTFDGREVIYPFGELDTLVLAYATTIHKSQGSEYPAVVIPITTQHWTMLARNLLYTDVTRGKRLVVLIGQRKAIGIAVRGGKMKPRWTKLREWLAVSTNRRLQARPLGRTIKRLFAHGQSLPVFPHPRAVAVRLTRQAATMEQKGM